MSEYIVSGSFYKGADNEEIVRCRDCKHCEMQKVRYRDEPLLVCIAEWCKGSEGDNPLVESNGFCAWGERKERIES